MDEIETLRAMNDPDREPSEGSLEHGRRVLARAIEKESTMQPAKPTAKRSLRWALVPALGLAVGAVTALAVVGGDSEAPDVDRAEVIASMSAGGSLDYEPADSPKELASWSDLVVSGQIAGFERGTEWLDPEGLKQKSLTLILDVSEYLKGDAPQGGDGRLYVQLYGYARPEQFEKAIPAGTGTTAYLVDEHVRNTGDQVIYEDAGRPSGQPLFSPTNPQALLLADEAGGDVLQPLEGAAFRNASLADFSPNETRFPGPEQSIESVLRSGALRSQEAQSP